jgi:hypothetical protein
MRVHAIIMRPATPQTTAMPIMAPVESGFLGFAACGGEAIREVIATVSFVNRVLFTPMRYPIGGRWTQPAWRATRTAYQLVLLEGPVWDAYSLPGRPGQWLLSSKWSTLTRSFPGRSYRTPSSRRIRASSTGPASHLGGRFRAGHIPHPPSMVWILGPSHWRCQVDKYSGRSVDYLLPESEPLLSARSTGAMTYRETTLGHLLHTQRLYCFADSSSSFRISPPQHCSHSRRLCRRCQS